MFECIILCRGTLYISEHEDPILSQRLRYVSRGLFVRGQLILFPFPFFMIVFYDDF